MIGTRPNIGKCSRSTSHKYQLLDYALSYAQRGWAIMPMRGKRPAVNRWKPFQKNPPDENTLRKLFAQKNLTGIAVILGSASHGLANRDFDKADSYHRWAKENALEAKSAPTVRTKRGFHVYGKLDKDLFRNLDDGEFRADPGHYVMLPPSLHPDVVGLRYEWVVPLPSGELPSLPYSLIPTSTTNNSTQIATQLPSQTACVPNSVKECILQTIPSGIGLRNKKIFELIRRLKAISPSMPPSELKEVMQEWFRLALPFIGTKDWQTTWDDAKDAWQNAKTPYGNGTIQDAYAYARANPHPPIDDNPELGVLSAFCMKLAGIDGKFFLAVRTVESLFGWSRMTAHRRLKDLVLWGVIEEVQKGTKKNNQATVWRYIGQ